MLKAWNTGHPGGIATVHANSARSALYRLEQLVQESVVTVPKRDRRGDRPRRLHPRRGNGRRIETIAEVSGLDAEGDYAVTDLAPHRLHAVYKENPCICPNFYRLDPFNGASLAIARTAPPSRFFRKHRACRRLRHAMGGAASTHSQIVQGPVAKIVAVIIIIITGLTLAFGDGRGGFRHLIQIVFGLSIAFAATSFFLSFFSFGGGALI